MSKSKKKARRGTIATSKTRDEALETLFGEDIHVKAPAIYLGSSTVGNTAGRKPEEIKAEVAAAAERAVLQKLKHKVMLTISSELVGFVLPKKHQLMAQFPAATLALMQLDSKNNARVIIVTKLAHFGVVYCHVLEMKKKDAVAAVEKGRAFMSQLDRSGSAVNLPGKIVGVIDGVYIGSSPVSKPRGDEMCLKHLDDIRKANKKKKDTSLGHILVVGTEGVRIFEGLTQDELVLTSVGDISHVTVLDEGKPTEVFAYVERDDRLDQCTARFFACKVGIPDSLCRAVGKARDLITEELEAAAGDPFAPDDQDKVEDISDILAKAEIERTTLTAVKVLGQGQFGKVHLAIQTLSVDTPEGAKAKAEQDLAKAGEEKSDSDDEDEAGEDEGTVEVQRAVKMLRSTCTDEDKAEFTREAEIMLKLDHPNIIKLVAVCFKHRPQLAVLELMQYSDLKAVLQACKTKGIEWGHNEQLLYSRKIAEGLGYISEHGFVHLDVAARNVLVHTNNDIKISDFGLTQPVDPETKTFRLRKHLRLAVRWMAPETLHGKKIFFSEYTDVYSFAVLMWEILSYGELPFVEMNSRDAKQAIEEGAKLKRPAVCPDPFWELIQSCWVDEPEERPKFAALVEKLTAMEAEANDKMEPCRDIGLHLNKQLTKNLRRLSKKASIARKSKKFSMSAPAMESLAEEEEPAEEAGPAKDGAPAAEGAADAADGEKKEAAAEPAGGGSEAAAAGEPSGDGSS